MNPEVPYHLMAAWFNKTITADEKAELDNWVNLSNENKEIFDQTLKLLDTPIDQPNYPDTNQSWSKLQAQLNLTTTKNPKFTFYKIAAVLTATFLIGLVLKLFWFNTSLIHVSTAYNQVKQITLPDGSSIWLNQNSDISYQKSFRTRNVTLTGEAYFEVVSNTKKPFTVESDNSLTTVLGTGFTVNTTVSDSLLGFVSVKHGKVQVVQKISNLSVVLINNQKALILPNGNITQTPVNSTNEFAWQEKKLVFNNQTIEQIFSDLSNYYHVTFSVENEGIYHCKFTGEFNNPNLNDLMLVISKTLNLTYTISNNSITVKGTGC